MLYWSIILFIFIIIFIVSLTMSRKNHWDSILWGYGVFASSILVLTIVATMLITTCEYRSFLVSFEAQRTIITQMSQTYQFNDNAFIYVADIIDANQELAKRQGNKKAWGGWCMYPDSIMDIVPIGLEN